MLFHNLSATSSRRRRYLVIYVCISSWLPEYATKSLLQTGRQQLHANANELQSEGAPFSRNRWSNAPLPATKLENCAVVGNSGVLRRHSHGAEIDAADMVFRFNDAPTGKTEGPEGLKYGAMVGSKENIRFVSLPFIKLATKDPKILVPGVKYILWQPDPKALPALDELAFNHSEVEFYHVKPPMIDKLNTLFGAMYHQEWWANIFRADLIDNPRHIWKVPSTGAVGMALALTMCRSVKAFGMAATPTSLNDTYHYYKSPPAEGDTSLAAVVDQPTRTANDHAGFFAEKDLWRRLSLNSHSNVDALEVSVIPGFEHLDHGVRCENGTKLALAGQTSVPAPKTWEDWVGGFT